MLEKILRTLRKMLIDSETNAVLTGDSATAIIGHALGLGGIGHFVVTMPATHGMLVEYTADMALACTVESYANPTITAETGTVWPMRNRYLGRDDSNFFDVIKDPTVTDPGTLLTSVVYGAKTKAGAETGTSWFYIPPGLSILFKYISGAASNNVVTRVNAQLVIGQHEHLVP
jgi:hypothetical protein